MTDKALVTAIEALMVGTVGLTVRALLESPGIAELTLTQWRVMAVIADSESPLRVSDIAARSGASLPSASRLIARLRDRSLVAVTSVDADRRASLVSLTDAGREAMRNVRSARRRMITEAIAGIEVRRGSFGEQLKVLAEGIRGYEARQLRPR